jgi:hypothetical protein
MRKALLSVLFAQTQVGLLSFHLAATRIRESQDLEFRAEFFNFLNHPASRSLIHISLTALVRLNTPRRNSLNEGHGFSRAVKSHSHEGFRGCVRTGNEPQIGPRPVGPGFDSRSIFGSHTASLAPESSSQLRSFEKSGLREFTIVTTNPMLSCADKLSAQGEGTQ